MAKIQITSGLLSKLPAQDMDNFLQDLLFEAPDELMEWYAATRNPVEVEVSDTTADVMTSMAESFGVTPLGLCVVLERVYPKFMEWKAKYEEYLRRTAT